MRSWAERSRSREVGVEPHLSGWPGRGPRTRIGATSFWRAEYSVEAMSACCVGFVAVSIRRDVGWAVGCKRNFDMVSVIAGEVTETNLEF